MRLILNHCWELFCGREEKDGRKYWHECKIVSISYNLPNYRWKQVKSSKSKDIETESDSDDKNDRSIENPGEEDDGVVRMSTLNLVDLSGLDSVRHTWATGDRQKEGGRINRRRVYVSHSIWLIFYIFLSFMDWFSLVWYLFCYNK